MQIKIFTIPIIGGELMEEELNRFLRSKKILLVENQLQGNAWSFCVKYVDDVAVAERDHRKIDYLKELDPATFKKFSELRAIRKRVAAIAAVQPYIIFTDAELAEMARLETITPETLKSVKGVGDKKLEKYGHHFFSNPL